MEGVGGWELGRGWRKGREEQCSHVLIKIYKSRSKYVNSLKLSFIILLIEPAGISNNSECLCWEGLSLGKENIKKRYKHW